MSAHTACTTNNFQRPLKSSFYTPKKRLIKFPIILARNQYDNFIAPYKRENMDASILGGMILAIRVTAAMFSKAKATAELKKLMKAKNIIGSIPKVMSLTRN